MEISNLPNDVIMYMALNMDIPEILSLCNTSNRFNNLVCNNQKYWMNRLLKEFPERINTQNVSRWGPDYKTFYRDIAYHEIDIDVSINFTGEPEDDTGDESEDPEEVYINASSSLVYHVKQQNIKSLLTNIFNNVSQRINVWGYYTISIDGDDSCQDVKRISEYCFEDIDGDTGNVSLFISSVEPLDYLTDDLLKDILDSSIQETRRI